MPSVVLLDLPVLVSAGLRRALELGGMTVLNQWPHSYAAGVDVAVLDMKAIPIELKNRHSRAHDVHLIGFALGDVTVTDAANMLSCGGRGIIDINTSEDDVRLTVQLALRGACVLPASVAKRLGALSPSRAAPSLSHAECNWMRAIASGRTLAQLAEESGYSARHMARLIAQLYRRMGVRSKAAALVLVARTGLLDEPRPGEDAPHDSAAGH